MDDGRSAAQRLTLQFHITGRCNLACRHCYREAGDVQPLSLEDVLRVLDEFEALAARWNRERRSKRKPRVNITGGEPLLREDIEAILLDLGARRDRMTFGVLTNGTLLDDEMIALLKRTRVSMVQLSLDGDREMHDQLRAPGDYERTLRTAKRLRENGIYTVVSFTAHAGNMDRLPDVARACAQCGAHKLWSDRLVPIGRGEQLLSITDAQLPEYLHALREAQRAAGGETQVAMERALQFMGGGSMYACGAGDRLITVDEFGTVMPCRRMPIPCGSIFSSTLEETYYGSGTFCSLRRRELPAQCAACAWRESCRGGALCQSYAACGDFVHADPACPLAAVTQQE